jgi:hypothetical protein
LFFFFFYFFLFPYSIQLYRPPTDAGIEPEESLPFGAVVHGGHVAQMLGRPAGARRSQIRSQDVENRSPTDGRRTGAAFRHDVDSARLNVKFQSRPKQMKNERKTRIVLTFIWEFFFGQEREISKSICFLILSPTLPVHVKVVAPMHRPHRTKLGRHFLLIK